jgi:hypothetical protein
MLPTRMNDDRLEQFTLVEGADNGRDRVHQLEVLSFHVAGKQALRIGSELEKPVVKVVRELSTHRPDRVERFPDELNLLWGHCGIHCVGHS